MQLVLVVNSGSSSMKFQLIDLLTEQKLVRGLVEKIGTPNSRYRIISGNEIEQKEIEVKDHRGAVEIALDYLTHRSPVHLKSLQDIDGVGHRVVQGGSTFDKAAFVTPEVKEKIKEYGVMAPLHNYANLAGVEACEALMPGIPQVVVFDTTFHQTMAPEAYFYGIPYKYYEKYQVRRYGAHGTSHKYTSEKALELLNMPKEGTKMIVCHLGSGSSITAIKDGKVVDTSMGFTPLEGLMMGTRSGDIDPAAVLFLMKQENLSPDEMDLILNKQSGLLGVSGISSDMRELEDAMTCGNKRAELAHKMFIYRIKKTIGSYAAVLNGLDVLVFTAGIGENNDYVREMICQDMDFLGIKLDAKKNHGINHLFEIGDENAHVKIVVVPTDEEMAIAKETESLVLASKVK